MQSIDKPMKSLTDHGLGDRDPSAADDRVLVQSAVRDPKAPCSELRQQWRVPELLTGDLTRPY